ncbi:LysR family transcriptional regulator [Periweissella cryptocerci]|nr:LysR family transcriptional regulator [Periweissella cryptocerci]
MDKTEHMQSFDIRLLYIFSTVAELKSVSRTAEILNLSQPTITKSIHQLEIFLNMSLFTRNKGMMLTAAGQRAYEHSQYVLKSFETFGQIRSKDI